MTKRAALYARVSTRDKGQEPENQNRNMQELLPKEGWELYKLYEDHETGSKSDRAAFLQMMRDAHAKRFDVLVFWSLDRLTREGALKTLQYLERLTKLGIGWRSYTEPYLDSCGVFGDVVISILATVAKQERIRIVERVKAGMLTAVLKASCPLCAVDPGMPCQGEVADGEVHSERFRAAGVGRPRAELDIAQLAERRSRGESWSTIGAALGVSRETCRRAALRWARSVIASSNRLSDEEAAQKP